MTDLLNSNATAGHNQGIDYAQQVTERMASEYAETVKTLDQLLDEARALPTQIDDDQAALNTGAVIKRFKDLDGRVENVRVVEGEPYLRSKNAIDAFFFGLRDRIGRRNKNDRSQKAGAVDFLQARINDYQDRKIAAERARLEAERREAERKAREAAQKAAAEAAAAEAARQAAERARKPETAAVKASIADQQAGRAAEAASLAKAAEEHFDDAVFASTAKPAEIARVRGNDSAGGGVTLTVAKENFAVLVDRDKLDLNILRPFFTEEALEKALRAWARTTNFRVQMDGAEIGSRNKGVTR